MENVMASHLLLVAVLVLSVYSQLTMKSRALVHGSTSGVEKLNYLFGMATDWLVLSAVGATFLAGVCWILAIEDLELGYAFPFMALSFVLIPVAASLFLGERISIIQLIGLGLVFAGVTLSAASR
jgi:drug/metabolite transporter (DMT)-like permease